ncbi:Fanconi anemia core complex-associated protein 100 [Parambassis ranga]|uniref:Fanconi anemia core complex-associated protein 100 n=1 Tax=Parambassis ranga TaxID=210632 RepID=A0A6P7KCP0_9TELE|nr:Fanconi anemia core complex-associated protein 100 [Parambassis ranga]
MEGRCAVESWIEFGYPAASSTPRVTFGFGADVFICTGSNEIYVFNVLKRKLTAVLCFSDPVADLVESHDKQLLYVACKSGVYCVSSQLLHRAQISSAAAPSSPAELKISSEFLVIAGDGISSLLLVGSVLLTLRQTNTSWLLSPYKTPKQAQSSSYEVLSAVSLPLLGDTESKAGLRRRTALVCIHCGDATPPPSSPETSHGHFRLDPILFKLLFGVEAALAKSPVILCSLPDGRLCFFPLRLPGSRLRVLHSLEQPVVFLGASVVMEPGPGHSYCLVAVGEQGRVVLIKSEKEFGDSLAGFTEGCIPGPVVCGCVDENNLYCSTGSDLLKLDLSKGSVREGKEEETSSNTATGLQSPTSLNVCRVTAITVSTHKTTGVIELLALSVRGQLQKISLPVRTEDALAPKMPSTQMGRNVRDLLSAIGDVCKRASVLKGAIKSKNQILRHLNQVLNISFLLVTNTNTEEHLTIQEKLIRCHGTTSWSRLLQRDSLNLTCVLDNSSPYVLERGWTLSITAFPLSCPFTAGGESSSTNFSFPLHTLHPGETLEVVLPVAAAGDTSFPMTASCSLSFSLTSLLGEAAAASFPGLQSSCISLPLNTLTVDWLHTLQVSSPTATLKTPTCQFRWATDGIESFLSSRQVRCSGRESASKPEKYSARVQVSSELLRDTLKSLKGDSENLSVSILDWLLSEGAGGVKMGHHGDKIAFSSSVVYAHGPNGATVKLTAKEINVGEDSTEQEESVSVVKVQVESSSIAAVCGLHHAVLCRIQALLQRAPEKAASIKVQILGLRQALERAETQQNQISGAVGVGISTGQVNRLLLNVYKELRDNPLLII